MFLTRVSIILSTLYFASGKIYRRCELARELRNFDMPEDEIATWVCIAQHESNYDTSAMNPGSGDHGLFQISQIYWCSPPGDGYGCNSPCSKFRDDDIADDLQCIRRIHNEHRRISGDGFDAWVVYPLFCKGDNSNYTLDCVDEENQFNTDIPISNITENEISTEDVDSYGDGYHFPALPSTFPKKQHEEEYGDDGYEFPKLPYSKASIHEYLSIETTPLQRDSKMLEERMYKLPFSRTSIHDATAPVEQKEYRFSNIPFSKTSIHYSIPTTEAKEADNNYPFSKQSIHHFIPVHMESQEQIIMSVMESSFTSQRPLLSTYIESSVKRDDNVLQTTERQLPQTTYSVSPPPSTTVSSHSTTETATRKPSAKQNDLTTTGEIFTSPRHVFISTESKSPTYSKVSLIHAHAKTFNGVSSTTISNHSILNSQITSTTTTPHTTAKSSELISTTQFLPVTYRSLSSTKLVEKPRTTTKLPNMSASKSYSTMSTRNALIEAASLYTSAPKNNTTERSTFPDLEGASSTAFPIRALYTSSTTTFTPFITTFTRKPFISAQITQKPFSRSTSFKSITSTSSSPRSDQTITSIKAPRAKPFAASNSTKLINTTPIIPIGRQVTFAPNSFLSWLFNSQTLPPLVRPPRPSSRPTTLRPDRPERPGGLPRPSSRPPLERPQGPLGSETTRRPFPMRPNMSSGPRPSTRPPLERPQGPLGSETTRRPFPMRPNNMSSIPRPARPLQRPFRRPPGLLPNRPLRPRVANNGSSFYLMEDNLYATKQAEGEHIESSTDSSSKTSKERSNGSRNIKPGEVAIKLEENVVFVRTKYGYRLFRT